MDLESIKSWISKNKVVSCLFIVIALLISIVVYQGQSKPEQQNKVLPLGQLPHLDAKDANETKASMLPVEQVSKEVSDNKQVATEINVDIKGAVKFSGVYPAKSNQVVNDIVNLAVPLKNADLDAVNLAATLQEAMVIYVPFKGEVKEDKFAMYKQQSSGNKNNGSNGQTNQKVVNINTAEQSALEEIPGIGPKKAQEIIQYRDANGGFKTIEEIKEIKGIGDKTFESLKDFIAI